MRGIFVSLVCILAVGAVSSARISSITNWDKIESQDDKNEIRVPLIPPIDDPLLIGDIEEENIDTEFLKGKVILRNAKVVGLGNMTNNFNIIIANGNTTFRINAPSAVIDGDYDINVTITLPQMDPVTVVGDGKFSFSLINGMGFITFILPIFGKLELRNLQIYLDFDTFEGHADNFKINDELVDWEALSENAKPIFESIWDPIRDPLIETITNVVNGIIGDCTLLGDIVPWLMDGGEMPDCLVFPTLPPTGPTEPTTVTTTTEPTEPTTAPPEHSFLPPLPDPMSLPDLIEDDLDLGFVQGRLAFTNSQIIGLSGLNDGISYNPISQMLTLKLNMTNLNINGDYDMEITALGDAINVAGQGDYSFAFTNPAVTIKAKQNLVDKVNISEMDIDIQFDNFVGFCEGMTFNGETVDWTQLSQLITDNFDVVWGAVKANVINYLTETLNTMYKECTVLEVLVSFFTGEIPDCATLPTMGPTTITTTTEETTTKTEETTTTTTTESPSDNGSVVLKTSFVVYSVIPLLYMLFI